jgi:class 3 adenylate cyclase
MGHPSGVRDDLPTGTVAFLFSDIESSTGLLDELGAAAYADTLATHRREDASAIATCLSAASGVLASWGDAGPATGMLGAALATFRRLRISATSEEQAESDETEACCRALLSDEEFSRAWAESEALETIAAADWALTSPGRTWPDLFSRPC